MASSNSFQVRLEPDSPFASTVANDCRFYCSKQAFDTRWNCTGSTLATAADGIVRMWEISDRSEGTMVKVFDPYRKDTSDATITAQTAIHGLAWHPLQPDILASISYDTNLRIWDARLPHGDAALSMRRPQAPPKQGEPPAGQLGVLKLPDELVDVAWRPTGDFLVIGDRDDLFYTVDVRKGYVGMTKISTFNFDDPNAPMVNDMLWSANGKRLLMATHRNGNKAGDRHGVVNVFRFCDRQFQQERQKEQQARGGGDQQQPADTIVPTVAATVPEVGKLLLEHSLLTHQGRCSALDLDPQQRRMATAGEDGIVALWDLEDLSMAHGIDRTQDSSGLVTALNFSHDGRFLASGSEKGLMDVAEASTGKRAAQYNVGNKHQKVHAVSWHPQQYLLATSCGRGRRDAVRLVRFVTGSHNSGGGGGSNGSQLTSGGNGGGGRDAGGRAGGGGGGYPRRSVPRGAVGSRR